MMGKSKISYKAQEGCARLSKFVKELVKKEDEVMVNAEVKSA